MGEGKRVLNTQYREARRSHRKSLDPAPKLDREFLPFCSPVPAKDQVHLGCLSQRTTDCPYYTPIQRTRLQASSQGLSLLAGPRQVLILCQRGGLLCGEFVSRKGSKPSSIGAYVHRAINRKDLQSSPGPQQPHTLSGITYDDLSHQPRQLSH